MSYLPGLGGLVGFLFMAGQVCAGDGAFLVKVEGFDRSTAWQAMSERDFQRLKKIITSEKPLFAKAVEQAAMDWQADKSNRNKSFPRSRLKYRSILTSISFPTLEKAEAQLLQYQDQEARNQERQEERLSRANKRTRVAAKAEMKKDQAKDAVMAEAADLVKAKMDALVH